MDHPLGPQEAGIERMLGRSSFSSACAGLVSHLHEFDTARRYHKTGVNITRRHNRM